MTPHRVAIIADAHFHDIEGDFGGAGLVIAGRRIALRSWRDTEGAARAVNESGAALRAALDLIAAEGVRHVVLAGDYTDDGQVENTRRLAALLDRYQHAHGLRFYAIPGNHDVFGPAGKHVSTRFVTGAGGTVLVTSDPEVAATEPGAVLTPAMRCLGLPEALFPMARFGLFRQPSDLHWESPFGPSDAPEDRRYDATAADGSVTHRLMDASYLVEPEPGLWLLLLDGTVFEPRPGRLDPSRKKAFLDPATAGWNAALRVKPFLLRWIADVAARARAGGKTLLAVSHYPVLDPFRDAAGSEAALFGPTQRARRTPSAAVAEALIGAGLRWHAGGHLHVSATTRRTTPRGVLTDVAVPSLAAFPAALAIVRASPDRVQTDILDIRRVPQDPRIRESYRGQGRRGELPEYPRFVAEQFRRHVIDIVAPRDWPPALWRWAAGADCALLVRRLGGEPVVMADAGGLTGDAFRARPVAQLVADAYLIRAGGPLAREAVDPDDLRVWQTLARTLGDDTADPAESDASFLRRFLSVVRTALDRMLAPDPA